MFGPQLVELLEGFFKSVTLLKDLCIRVSWLGFFFFKKRGLYVALAVLEFKSQHYQLVLSALCLLIRCKL